MMVYQEHEQHSIVERPETTDIVEQAYNQAKAQWGAESCCWVIGWWEVWNWGAGIGHTAYIAYPKSHYSIDGFEDGWIYTENRGHWLRPPTDCGGTYWAVECLAPQHYQHLETIPIALLERGSPIGYGPTRMFPLEDIVTGGKAFTEAENRKPAYYQAHVQQEPSPAVLEQVLMTAQGAILYRPRHSLDIDRVWYHLARTWGCQAERDIEAYLVGWWQERNPHHPPTSAVYLAFEKPRRVLGFHHPPRTTEARWIYLYNWYSEVRPLPKAAGPAEWAVEYVMKGETPVLQHLDLTTYVPQRKIVGVASDALLSPAQIAAVHGDEAWVNALGKTILHLPIATLAGLCWSTDLDTIARFAWHCARWVTSQQYEHEIWPVAVRRYHQWLWDTGRYVE